MGMPVDLTKIDPAELQEYREVFSLVDEDGSGEIGKEEIASLMATLGIGIGDEELDKMILEIDEDGSGEIGFDEFCAIMAGSSELKYTPDDIKRAFATVGGEAPIGCASLDSVEDFVMKF